jgi:adenylosuccinate lyase
MEYTNYLSPFTWRYGSAEMRRIWSEENKRRLWRQVWLALAQVQAGYGLVTQKQLDDLACHATDIDIPRALEIEKEIHHDLMAELAVYAGQCSQGGAILHLGATSMDIEDNADVLRIRQSTDLLISCLKELLIQLALRIEQWAEIPIMAFTHLQPAEPSTLGYRFANYAQDILEDWRQLNQIRSRLAGKGFKGAVGTGAAYAELIGLDHIDDFEQRLSDRLELPFYPVSSQVYPRKQDYILLSALAGLGASLSKFALDLRFLQSPAVGEWSEPFSEKQVGSSAMPFKRNPIQSEKINSLARYLAQMPRTAWDNAANSMLERTLDDSANRRIILPEAFLICDELISSVNKIVTQMQIDQNSISANLSVYAPFSASERVLVNLVKAGADRQEMHERLRQHAMVAWEQVRQNQVNPLVNLVCGDGTITQFIPSPILAGLFDITLFIGFAPQRAYQIAREIEVTLDHPVSTKEDYV